MSARTRVQDDLLLFAATAASQGRRGPAIGLTAQARDQLARHLSQWEARGVAASSPGHARVIDLVRQLLAAAPAAQAALLAALYRATRDRDILAVPRPGGGIDRQVGADDD